MKLVTVGLLSSAAMLAATSAHAEQLMVLSKGGAFSQATIDQITGLGATVVTKVPQIGMIVVETDRADFRAVVSGIAGVQSAIHDFTASTIDPARVSEVDIAASAAEPPFTGLSDTWVELQWPHAAIHSPSAWAAGYKGAGVRVAVLDSGIRSGHIEFTHNLNKSLSTSFVPGEGQLYT